MMAPPIDNGNARMAVLETNIEHIRKDMDSWRIEVRGELASIQSTISRVGWMVIGAVIIALLANIGLGG